MWQTLVVRSASSAVRITNGAHIRTVDSRHSDTWTPNTKDTGYEGRYSALNTEHWHTGPTAQATFV